MLAGGRDLKFHISSLKFKAFTIEKWIEENVHASIRHTFGYNCDELSRVEDSEEAIKARVTFGFNIGELARVAEAQLYDGPKRQGHYPLVLWGWDRDRCQAYILEKIGVLWRKSACPFCPFARITSELIARQYEFPEETAAAMFLERVALAMNPKAQLFSSKPLYVVVSDSGNKEAIRAFDALMEMAQWSVYRVRRIYRPKAIYQGEGKNRVLLGYDATRKGSADRCVERLQIFDTRILADTLLLSLGRDKGQSIEEQHGLKYVQLLRPGTTYPTTQEYFVTAPAVVETKARYGIADFDDSWQDLDNLYCGSHDLPLFESIQSSNLIQIT